MLSSFASPNNLMLYSCYTGIASISIGISILSIGILTEYLPDNPWQYHNAIVHSTGMLLTLTAVELWRQNERESVHYSYKYAISILPLMYCSISKYFNNSINFLFNNANSLQGVAFSSTTRALLDGLFQYIKYQKEQLSSSSNEASKIAINKTKLQAYQTVVTNALIYYTLGAMYYFIENHDLINTSTAVNDILITLAASAVVLVDILIVKEWCNISFIKNMIGCTTLPDNTNKSIVDMNKADWMKLIREVLISGLQCYLEANLHTPIRILSENSLINAAAFPVVRFVTLSLEEQANKWLEGNRQTVQL